MLISESLSPIIWSALGVSLLAAVALVIGITLLLGTVPHRKVALPLIWISATVLITGLTLVIVILAHS